MGQGCARFSRICTATHVTGVYRHGVGFSLVDTSERSGNRVTEGPRDRRLCPPRYRPIKVQTQVEGAEPRPESYELTEVLVNKFSTMFPGDQKPPFSMEFSGGELVVRRDDEAEMAARAEVAVPSDTSFSATPVNIGGEQYVRIESDAVESGR